MIRRTRFRLVLCCCMIVATLTFIWGNSLLPAEQSAALSQWVAELLSKLLPGESSGGTGDGLLRKLAHFSEFCLLGFGLGWLFGMLHEKYSGIAARALLCGVTAACVDETLQFLSPGRSPGVLDVLIDSAGVCLGAALLILGIIIRKKNNITYGGKQQ